MYQLSGLLFGVAIFGKQKQRICSSTWILEKQRMTLVWKYVPDVPVDKPDVFLHSSLQAHSVEHQALSVSQAFIVIIPL